MKKHLVIYFIIVSMFIVSCTNGGNPANLNVLPKDTTTTKQTATPDATVTHQTELTLTTTITPNLYPTPEETKIPDTPPGVSTKEIFNNESEEDKFPPLLVSLSTSSKNSVSCISGQTTEIIYVGADSDVQLLLSDPNKNYTHSSWAPVENSFAFVESSFGVVEEDYYGDVRGFDSIWILDLKTGVRQKVSDDLPNLYNKHEYGCKPVNLVNSRPSWSPDARYLLYGFWDSYASQAQYYLVDLATGETINLPVATFMVIPTWFPDRNMIVAVEEKNLRVLDVNSLNEITQRVISFPPEMQLYKLPEWIIFNDSLNLDNFVQFYDSSTIIGSFYLVSRQSRLLSTWMVDLNTGDWTKIKNATLARPILGENFAISCDDLGLMYFQEKGEWKNLTAIEAFYKGVNRCNQVAIFQSSSGNEYGSFVEYDQGKILVENFANNKISVMFNVVDMPTYNAHKYIVNYSLRK